MLGNEQPNGVEALRSKYAGVESGILYVEKNPKVLSCIDGARFQPIRCQKPMRFYIWRWNDRGGHGRLPCVWRRLGADACIRLS
ncbi:hypothetical protein D3C79_700980 [compost metagenome]